MALRNAWPSKAVQADADDMRYNLRGNVVRSAAGVPRRGLLGYRSAPLVTSDAAMKVRVAAFDAVTTRDGGVLFLANDGVWDVPLDAAPSVNSRIDVLYAKQNDSTETVGTPDPSGGADTNRPVFVVVKGTAAPIPTKPTTVPEGGVELATVTIPAGVAATNSVGVVITQTHQFTAMTGGVVPVRNVTERDNGFDWAEGTTIVLADTGDQQTRWGGEWDPALPMLHAFSAADRLVTTTTYTDVLTSTFTTAYGRRVDIQATLIAQCSVNTAGTYRITLNGEVLGTSTRVHNLGHANAPQPYSKISKGRTLPGTNTVKIQCNRDSAGGQWNAAAPQIEVWAD